MSSALHHLFAALQQSLPQHRLTALANRLAHNRQPWAKNLLIRAFCESFNINLQEAQPSCIEDYPHFNAFFTRALKSDARPLPKDPHVLISPCDGTVSQMGPINDDRLIQAKGIDYSLSALLGADDDWSQKYWSGSFATIYLSPRDYHRVHMPLNGTLQQTRHIPGRLFSVNDASAGTIPGLFTRNERLVCRFQSDSGEFTLILVGAMLVAGIETIWDGLLERRETGATDQRDWLERQIMISRGAEMGRFNYGSTVIVLFPTHPFKATLSPGTTLRMGAPL